jgi:hypothetical protein
VVQNRPSFAPGLRGSRTTVIGPRSESTGLAVLTDMGAARWPLVQGGRAAGRVHRCSVVHEITVPYDVFGKTSTMRKDWSFSAFIEYSDKRILFDMGKTKGIDRIVPSPAYR